MENFAIYLLKINSIAAVVIVLVLLISYFVKKRYSAKWKYTMWLAIGLFLLFPFYAFNVNQPIKIEFRQESSDNAVEETVDKTAIQKNNSNFQISAQIGNNTKTQSKQNQGVTISKRTLAFEMKDLLTAFVKVWAVGIIVLVLCKLFLYHTFIKRMLRWAIPEKDNRIISLYKNICVKENIKNPPKLMLNSKLNSPILAGLRKVYLCIPSEHYSDEELELIFSHELCHYNNKDLWYKMFLLIVNTIFWFNPFLYLMKNEAQKDIEYICDSRVVMNRSQEECISYGKLLIKTAAEQKNVSYVTASLNDSMMGFKERIRYMMKVKKLKYGFSPVVFCLMLLLVANLLIGCSMDGKESKNADSGKSSETLSEEEKDTPNSDKKEETTTEDTTEDTSNTEETTAKPEELDKSGDYMGNIDSPLQPRDTTYRTCTMAPEEEKWIVLHITNIDNANFKFYLTEAVWKEGEEQGNGKPLTEQYTENVIFKEHVAHYNGNGYYEYIGNDYHLYFKYNAPENEDEAVAGSYQVEVYGLEKLLNPSQFGHGEIPNYNGVSGIVFIAGLPFAG